MTINNEYDKILKGVSYEKENHTHRPTGGPGPDLPDPGQVSPGRHRPLPTLPSWPPGPPLYDGYQ